MEQETVDGPQHNHHNTRIFASYQSLSLNHKLLFCISEINDFYRWV